MLIKLDEDLETMFISAIRYAIGRESYIPHTTIRYITPKLKMLSDRTIYDMERDLRETYDMDQRMKGHETLLGSRHGPFGDERIDKPKWLEFWDKVKEEKDRRRRTRD